MSTRISDRIWWGYFVRKLITKYEHRLFLLTKSFKFAKKWIPLPTFLLPLLWRWTKKVCLAPARPVNKSEKTSWLLVMERFGHHGPPMLTHRQTSGGTSQQILNPGCWSWHLRPALIRGPGHGALATLPIVEENGYLRVDPPIQELWRQLSSDAPVPNNRNPTAVHIQMQSTYSMK